MERRTIEYAQEALERIRNAGYYTADDLDECVNSLQELIDEADQDVPRKPWYAVSINMAEHGPLLLMSQDFSVVNDLNLWNISAALELATTAGGDWWKNWFESAVARLGLVPVDTESDQDVLVHDYTSDGELYQYYDGQPVVILDETTI